ncbi:Tannase/feruloyl esterase [Podospora appendiculata]|uniref:Carboxylic ester hydrolase n=1 Tax=Podospora appendiculata TaxID=314037 RepID=A0AAE0XK37_9PEZI|nr:Tannase/feruloyl esterase [Podospora appendiculata]
MFLPMLKSTAATSLALFASGVHSAPPQTRAALSCSTSSFTNVVTLPGVTVTIQSAVTKSGTYQEAGNLGFPQQIDLLPSLCVVTVKVTNTSDVPTKPQSSYRFGMFLPTAANWNKKIMTVGSASFAGGINWPDMAEPVHYGFATLSTDNGHSSNGSDLSWVTPARLYDWGYRAVHGSVVVGKLLTAHYYGKEPTYSYYSGCSTGGRQGLREIQNDANAFDGALIGAPAWDTVHLMPWISKMAYNRLSNTDGTLGTDQLNLLVDTILAQCDSKDNVTDNVISRPEQCNFDISQIVCSDPTRCLSQAQAQTAMTTWADYTVNGRLASHGFTIGSEDQWPVYFGDTNTLTGFDFSYERLWINNDTSYRWQDYTDQAVLDSEAVNPGQATANRFDISAYRTRGPGKKGGKIMMYHGLADGLIPPKASLQFYNQTMAATGSTLDDMRSWFRFFEVPGMQHCFFTPARFNAPWYFAGSGQATQLRLLPYLGIRPARGDGWSVPNHLNNSSYDALAALVQWVENDKPVDQVIATAFNADFSVNRTRPICPYPQVATHRSGNINDASSWKCV